MQGVQAALAGWRQSSKDKRPLISNDKKSESQSEPGGPFSATSQNGFRFRTGDIEGPTSAFGFDLSHFSNVRYFNASDFRSLIRDNSWVLAVAVIGVCVLIGLVGLLLALSPGTASADTALAKAAGMAVAAPSPGLALSRSESEPAPTESEPEETDSETETDADSDSDSNSEADPASKAADVTSAESVPPTLAPLVPRSWEDSVPPESPGPAPAPDLPSLQPGSQEPSAPAPAPAPAPVPRPATALGPVSSQEKVLPARSPAPGLEEPKKETQMLHASAGNVFHKIPIHVTTIEHKRKPDKGQGKPGTAHQSHAPSTSNHAHNTLSSKHPPTPKKKTKMTKGGEKRVFYPALCVGAVAKAHECNCPPNARCQRKYFCNQMYVCRCLGEFKVAKKDAKGNLLKCSKH